MPRGILAKAHSRCTHHPCVASPWPWLPRGHLTLTTILPVTQRGVTWLGSPVSQGNLALLIRRHQPHGRYRALFFVMGHCNHDGVQRPWNCHAVSLEQHGREIWYIVHSAKTRVVFQNKTPIHEMINAGPRDRIRCETIVA